MSKKILILALVFTASAWAQAINWSADTITITTAAQLREMSVLVASNQRDFNRQTIILANDIDLRGSATNQWVPIGWESNPFRGTFDGNNKVIRGIFINNTEDNQGLFGVVDGTIRNLGVVVNIRANNNVGGLVGLVYNTVGAVVNSHASGTVIGNNSIGGLVGFVKCTDYLLEFVEDHFLENHLLEDHPLEDHPLVEYIKTMIVIENSYASVNVTGSGSNIGGLVGLSILTTIVNSFATGNVTTGTNCEFRGNGSVGGLVGKSNIIINSYATGNVAGHKHKVVGGLAGWSCVINDSFATGNVSGIGSVGGLTGMLNVDITNSFASGNVISNTSDGLSGGLVGYNESGKIVNSFASGTVIRAGGIVNELVGYNFRGRDSRASTCPTSGIRTAAQMRQQSTFITWDFENTWRITPNRNNGFPHLQSILTPQERAAEQARIRAEEQRIQDGIRTELQRIQREEERKRQEWNARISAPNLQRLVFKSPRENQSNVVFEVGKQVPLQQDFSYNLIDKRVSFRFRDQRNLDLYINNSLVSSFSLRNGIIRKITIVDKNPNLGFGVFDVWGGNFR